MNATAATLSHDARRPDAGTLGIWFFILSEIMLFGAFLASYFTLRWGSADCALGVSAWPAEGRDLGLSLATLNTVILITSSFTMFRAGLSVEKRDGGKFSANMAATIFLGLLFLGIKAFEYTLKIHHGYYPTSEFVKANPGWSIFISFYFAMTGLHALHVIAGVLWNFFLWKGVRMDDAFARKTEYAGLYWHFVDVVWVFLFPLFYLV